MPHAAPSPPAAAPDAAPDAPTIHDTVVHVNDGVLAAADVAPLEPSLPSEPLDVLRARFRRTGYLFLKGLLPRGDVLAARRAYFTQLAPTGVLQPGTDPERGLFNRAAVPTDYPGVGAGVDGRGRVAEAFNAAALAAHTAPWYIGADGASGFAHHPALRAFVAPFSQWGADTVTVKRTILRNNCPGNTATGVHYDQIFLRGGEPTALTAWVPIGDCAVAGGGLMYLEDSEALGAQLEADFTRKAEAAGMGPEETRSAFNANMMATGFLCGGAREFGRAHARRWLVAQYEAGDVVLHSPWQIHASTRNTDPEGVIRLGTDIRYVNGAKAWDTRWNHHFRFGDGV